MVLRKRLVLKNSDGYYFTTDIYNYSDNQTKNFEYATEWDSRDKIEVGQEELYEFTNDGKLSFIIEEVFDIYQSDFDVDDDEIKDIKVG